ncbi:hypothetical protein B0H13DRAFT_1850202 [Mycena leptocephala]|nr:hypothetical protein B0H13DRAFT_1850202 [Mycena leptocephala]
MADKLRDRWVCWETGGMKGQCEGDRGKGITYSHNIAARNREPGLILKTRNKPGPKPKPKSILDGSAKATKKEPGPKKAQDSSDDADVPSDPEPLAKKPKQPKHVVNWGPEKKGNTVEYDEDGNEIKTVIVTQWRRKSYFQLHHPLYNACFEAAGPKLRDL